MIADEALCELSEDSDLFSCLGVNPYSDKYPARHSMHTAMLAMSIGTKLQFDRQTLKELAIGCLIHDAGMLKINEEAYSTPIVLDRIKFLEITKHPVLVFDMMKDMQSIPSRSAFIAYQIHERCDGSGYPRGSKSPQIHFLSKIAAVADSYIGLVSTRPHRPGMLPYRAIEKLLQGVNLGLYDAIAVRALLKTISLFPIGSYVELTDARQGKVLRSNGDGYNTPIVEVWQPGQLFGESEIVDLKENDNLKVAKPIAKLDSEKEFELDGDHWELK